MEKAVERGLDAQSAGVLVDEQFGSDIPELAPRSAASRWRCRSRRAASDEFDFQYGDDFGDHIEKYDLLATKVLVRLQPGRRRRDERAPDSRA